MKENLSKKSSNFEPTRNFAKCPKLAREAPRAIQKIKKNWAQKGPGPKFGPMGPTRPTHRGGGEGIALEGGRGGAWKPWNIYCPAFFLKG